MKDDDKLNPTPRIGWRECIGLPDLGLKAINAKVDTGARTTALHAENLRVIRGAVSGKPRKIEFAVPLPGRSRGGRILCRAKIADRRRVIDSGGHSEMRYVIVTRVQLGETAWPVEITLTDRSGMRFPMLLGRTALQGRFLVDTAHSYLIGKKLKKKKKKKRTGSE